MGTNGADTRSYTLTYELLPDNPIYDELVAVHPDPRFPAPAAEVDVKKTAQAMQTVAAAAKK